MAVTLDDVKKIIDLDDSVSDDDWTQILTNAQTWINCLSTSILSECGQACYDLTLTYLAAHLMTLRDPRQIEQEVFDARDKFSDYYGKGLDQSQYGQIAKQMDCTNQLASRDEARPTFIFNVMGR